MPYRVHIKQGGQDVVYTAHEVPADGTDITTEATPALESGSLNGTYRDAVYGEAAKAELAESKSKPAKAEGSK